ncbi:DUF3098 domain-containing protein [Porphyromonas pogonae]|uniref:DUF3098 domain-containing protein n=1 Tax=Porphyromonas pogonae TaxID=867595 RepID=UPI002E79C663|nr:DUF3098 domain-containing protein [Porphyromonas pogonae]
MLYGKKNYILMGASVLIILIGFVLMSGGGSADGVSFNPDIFSSRRIVLAPIICMIGFVLMIYAILTKPGRNK